MDLYKAISFLYICFVLFEIKCCKAQHGIHIQANEDVFAHEYVIYRNNTGQQFMGPEYMNGLTSILIYVAGDTAQCPEITCTGQTEEKTSVTEVISTLNRCEIEISQQILVVNRVVAFIQNEFIQSLYLAKLAWRITNSLVDKASHLFAITCLHRLYKDMIIEYNEIRLSYNRDILTKSLVNRIRSLFKIVTDYKTSVTKKALQDSGTNESARNIIKQVDLWFTNMLSMETYKLYMKKIVRNYEHETQGHKIICMEVRTVTQFLVQNLYRVQIGAHIFEELVYRNAQNIILTSLIKEMFDKNSNGVNLPDIGTHILELLCAVPTDELGVKFLEILETYIKKEAGVARLSNELNTVLNALVQGTDAVPAIHQLQTTNSTVECLLGVALTFIDDLLTKSRNNRDEQQPNLFTNAVKHIALANLANYKTSVTEATATVIAALPDTTDYIRYLQNNVANARTAPTQSHRMKSVFNRIEDITEPNLLNSGIQDVFKHLLKAKKALVTDLDAIDLIPDTEHRASVPRPHFGNFIKKLVETKNKTATLASEDAIIKAQSEEPSRRLLEECSAVCKELSKKQNITGVCTKDNGQTVDIQEHCNNKTKISREINSSIENNEKAKENCGLIQPNNRRKIVKTIFSKVLEGIKFYAYSQVLEVYINNIQQALILITGDNFKAKRNIARTLLDGINTSKQVKDFINAFNNIKNDNSINPVFQKMFQIDGPQVIQRIQNYINMHSRVFTANVNRMAKNKHYYRKMASETGLMKLFYEIYAAMICPEEEIITEDKIKKRIKEIILSKFADAFEQSCANSK